MDVCILTQNEVFLFAMKPDILLSDDKNTLFYDMIIKISETNQNIKHILDSIEFYLNGYVVVSDNNKSVEIWGDNGMTILFIEIVTI